MMSIEKQQNTDRVMKMSKEKLINEFRLHCSTYAPAWGLFMLFTTG